MRAHGVLIYRSSSSSGSGTDSACVAHRSVVVQRKGTMYAYLLQFSLIFCHQNGVNLHRSWGQSRSSNKLQARIAIIVPRRPSVKDAFSNHGVGLTQPTSYRARGKASRSCSLTSLRSRSTGCSSFGGKWPDQFLLCAPITHRSPGRPSFSTKKDK